LKILVITLNLEESRKVIEKNRWGAEPLSDTVDTISIKLYEDIHRLRHNAQSLHIEDFHKTKLRKEHVSIRYRDIEALVNLAKKIV
jgi:hypothetical protein